MNFTSDIKKEIIARGIGKGADAVAEKKAGISAFVRTSGMLGVQNGEPTFFLISETENVAEFFTALFYDGLKTNLRITHATMDRRSGRDKLLLECPAPAVHSVLKEVGLLKRTGGIRDGISASLTATQGRKIAYIQGAFLGGGSCTVPSAGADTKTGYHLEIVFFSRKTARDFCKLLMEFEILAKLLVRSKEKIVVYIKSKEQISDFFAVIGVQNALRNFSGFVEKRDEANRVNRAQNCMMGNAYKAATASVEQVMCIRTLIQNGTLNELGEEYKALAKARLENGGMSMQELAKLLGISKSCLNHRMRRLTALAKTEETETKAKVTEEKKDGR